MNAATLWGKFTGGNISQWLVLAGWSCCVCTSIYGVSMWGAA